MQNLRNAPPDKILLEAENRLLLLRLSVWLVAAAFLGGVVSLWARGDINNDYGTLSILLAWLALASVLGAIYLRDRALRPLAEGESLKPDISLLAVLAVLSEYSAAELSWQEFWEYCRRRPQLRGWLQLGGYDANDKLTNLGLPTTAIPEAIERASELALQCFDNEVHASHLLMAILEQRVEADQQIRLQALQLYFVESRRLRQRQGWLAGYQRFVGRVAQLWEGLLLPNSRFLSRLVRKEDLLQTLPTRKLQLETRALNQLLLDEEVVVILGNDGSGKTTLINELLDSENWAERLAEAPGYTCYKLDWRRGMTAKNLSAELTKWGEYVAAKQALYGRQGALIAVVDDLGDLQATAKGEAIWQRFLQELLLLQKRWPTQLLVTAQENQLSKLSAAGWLAPASSSIFQLGAAEAIDVLAVLSSMINRRALRAGVDLEVLQRLQLTSGQLWSQLLAYTAIPNSLQAATYLVRWYLSVPANWRSAMLSQWQKLAATGTTAKIPTRYLESDWALPLEFSLQGAQALGKLLDLAGTPLGVVSAQADSLVRLPELAELVFADSQKQYLLTAENASTVRSGVLIVAGKNHAEMLANLRKLSAAQLSTSLVVLAFAGKQLRNWQEERPEIAALVAPL